MSKKVEGRKDPVIVDQLILSNLIDKFTLVEPVNLAKVSNVDFPEDDINIKESEKTVEGIFAETDDLPLNGEVVFSNEILMNQYSKKLQSYLEENGLIVYIKNIHELFSSMAATRTIILESTDKDASIRFLELFSKFIGSYFHLESLDETDGFENLLKKSDGFKKFIKKASTDQVSINIAALTNVNLNEETESLRYFFSHGLNPNIYNLAHLYKNDNNYLFNNVWLFVIKQKSEEILNEKIILEASINLDIQAQTISPKDFINNNSEKLSYLTFTNQLDKMKDVLLLEEEYWKKFDKLNDYFSKFTKLHFDNRIFRQIENYTTMMLMCDNSQYEAIDSVLKTKILWMLLNLSITRTDQNNQSIIELFDRLFVLENISQSKKLLKKIEDNFHIKK